MKTFKRGGVHPKEYKELSENKAIESLAVPELLYIPVSQHLGAPARVTVNVGDTVDKGQVIAEAGGFVSANIHATVSGKVKAIQKIQNILGRMVDHVVIENDREERWAEGLIQERQWEDLSVEKLRDFVADAGIVGMGGATFPTHVKLNPPKDKPIDTLVINGAECEPFLTCDYRMMLEKTGGVVSGIKILKKILDVDKVLIGIEENKAAAFNKMREAVAGDPSISCYLLKVKYPQGAEKQLIKAVIDREVPPGGLPMDVGVVVHNIATCFATFEAVTKNMPLIERVVTVSGDAVERPANYLVRIGTPIKNLLEASHLQRNAAKIISGGPMMGVAIFNTELPVQKGTSGIVVLKDAAQVEKKACIRCGKCIEVCPIGIEPTELARSVEFDPDAKELEVLHALDCMECGSCTFVCPAQIPIVQYIKQAKQDIQVERQKEKQKEIEEQKK